MEKKRYSLGFMLTLVFAASALTCIVLSLLFYIYIGSDRDSSVLQFINSNRGSSSETTRLSKEFQELLDLIDSRFIGTFDIGDLTDEAMRAVVESLDDDWSYYLTPEEYTEFLESANNTYYGLGIEVSIDEETEGIRVLGVYSDSGADLAGILVDDLIIAIDGDSILGFSINEVRLKLRRQLGDSAVLTVIRDDEHLEITAVYNIVFRNPVTFEMLDNNIGYVVLRNFEDGSADEFISAVNELIEMGATAFIYDVRNNGGGRVGEVTDILDFLLPEGEIFISVDRSGIEKITRSDEEFIDLPAVVLVNVHSYSGAEFFAAMLSEYGYAPSVGEQTTGKNRMQTTIPLSNGGAVHISTGHYLTKNRISLFEAGGFTPEYLVELSDDELVLLFSGELDKESDRQLQKALSLLEDLR